MRAPRPLGPSRVTFLASTAAVTVALLLATWRALMSRYPELSGDQVNIATFALVQHEPSLFIGDLAFAQDDSSRFYTPWQVHAFWILWQSTGSATTAVGVQALPLAALALLASGLAMFLLRRNYIVAAMFAVAVLAFRQVEPAGDIWGLGPWFSILPRTWASPLIVLSLACWMNWYVRRDQMSGALAGLFAGIAVNVNPPSGVALVACIVPAVLLIALVRRRRSDWVVAGSASALALVAGAPFVLHYLANTGSIPPANYQEYIDVLRYRYGSWFVPDVLFKTGGASITSLAAHFSLLIAVVGASLVLVRSRLEREWLSGAALLAMFVVLTAYVLPAIAQITLLALRLNPLPTFEMFRGLRLLVPLGMLLVAFATADAIQRGRPRDRLIAAALATLLLAGGYLPLQFPSIGSWLALAGPVVLVALAGGTSFFRGRVLWRADALVAALTLAIPLSVGVFDLSRVGEVCCVSPSAEEVAIQELTTWVRTTGDARPIETSAVVSSTAQRLRFEARHAITYSNKDGGFLVYGSPEAAIDWYGRALKVDAVVREQSLDQLTRLAQSEGAHLIVLDFRVWRAGVPTARTVWRNAMFAVLTSDG